MKLTFQVNKQFSILPYRYMKRAEHVFEPVLELYARKFRKMALDASILEKNRLVIPANRTRGANDTLMKLKQNRETAGLILSRDKFPEVNFVLDQKQGFILRRQKHYLTQNYFVRLPETGEMIRVTINKLNFDQETQWIPWVHFNRFIVGKPNLLYLPIKIRRGYSNQVLNRGGMVIQKIEGVYVYSYNDDYPTILEIDPYNVTVVRPYQLGDLINILPDGVLLHKMYDSKLTQRIFYLKANSTKKLIKAVQDEQRSHREFGEAEERDEVEKFYDQTFDPSIKEEVVEEKDTKQKNSMFDHLKAKKTTTHEKELEELEDKDMLESNVGKRRKEMMEKKKEEKKKLGTKTPFKNVKKSILEEYSLKQSIKDEIESREKATKVGAKGETPSKK